MITPASSSMLGCLIVPMGFETSRKKTGHFLNLPTKLVCVCWTRELVSEVIGKRLQNFVVLFPQACGGGRVKVLSKLYILVKMFIL